MSFIKPWYFALLCAVILMPACAPKTGVFLEQCVSKGDTVTFGQYPQATETPEPIEWIVLDIDSRNEKMLLLSKYVLDGKPYDTKRTQTWDKCSLRNWLNHEFLNAVFSSSEQTSIQTTHLRNSDSFSWSYWAEGGADTDDKIFLLSPKDAKRYFRDNPARVAKATTYAIHNGPVVNYRDIYDSEICESDANVQCSATWWLRAPGTGGWEGDHSDFAAQIYKNGEISRGGETLREEIGVRPALWVHAPACANHSETPAAAVPAAVPAVEPPAPAPSAPAAHLQCDGPHFMGQCAAKGSTVMFGKYPQATETPDPIEWIVLDIDSPNNQILLLSKYVLDAYRYREYYRCDSNVFAPITWEESPLHFWLNHDFMYTVFSSSELKAIPMIPLVNLNNPYGTNGGNVSYDQVFLLSIAEVNRYFPSDADRKAKATSNAIRNHVWVSADLNTRDSDERMPERCANAQCDAVWWLRSPGYDDASAAAVRSGGDIDIYGSNICLRLRGNNRIPGVRPALWVNYAAAPNATEPSSITTPQNSVPQDQNPGTTSPNPDANSDDSEKPIPCDCGLPG